MCKKECGKYGRTQECDNPAFRLFSHFHSFHFLSSHTVPHIHLSHFHISYIKQDGY